MRACVYEVWHCVSLVHTAFCICHNPLSATLRQADNSRGDRQPNPLHCELGRSACKQQVTHTHTYTHTNSTVPVQPCNEYIHIHTHTQRENTHDPLRSTLLTPSPGSLQRVVVRFSRTWLSDMSSLSLSLLTLAYSLRLSQTLSFASRLQDAGTTDASVPLPFSSPLYSFIFPLSPSLSSSHS